MSRRKDKLASELLSQVVPARQAHRRWESREGLPVDVFGQDELETACPG
jgi:hypothetical protein